MSQDAFDVVQVLIIEAAKTACVAGVEAEAVIYLTTQAFILFMNAFDLSQESAVAEFLRIARIAAGGVLEMQAERH